MLKNRGLVKSGFFLLLGFTDLRKKRKPKSCNKSRRYYKNLNHETED